MCCIQVFWNVFWNCPRYFSKTFRKVVFSFLKIEIYFQKTILPITETHQVCLRTTSTHTPPSPAHRQQQFGEFIPETMSFTSFVLKDYSVSMYLRQSWTDERLTFDVSNASSGSIVRLGEDSWNSIWIPDTFFRNEKRATLHEVTVTNRLLRLYASGKLWYVIK